MRDAPETIWAWNSVPNLNHVGTWAKTRFPEKATEYCRADLPATDAQTLANEKVRALVEQAKITVNSYRCWEKFPTGTHEDKIASASLFVRINQLEAAIAALEGK